MFYSNTLNPKKRIVQSCYCFNFGNFPSKQLQNTELDSLFRYGAFLIQTCISIGIPGLHYETLVDRVWNKNLYNSTFRGDMYPLSSNDIFYI